MWFPTSIIHSKISFSNVALLIFCLSIFCNDISSILHSLFALEKVSWSSTLRAVLVILSAITISLNLNKSLLFSPPIFCTLIFFSIYSINAANAGLVQGQFLSRHWLDYPIRLLVTCILPMFAIASCNMSNVGANTLLHLHRFGVVICFLLIIKLTLDGGAFAGDLFSVRFSFESFDSISLGLLGVTLALVGTSRIRQQASLGPFNLDFTGGLSIIFGTLLVLLAGSKGPVFSYVAGFLCFLLLSLRNNPRYFLIGLSGFFVLVGVGFYAGYIFEIKLIHRLLAIHVDGSTIGRLQHMQEALLLVSYNPVLGGFLELPSNNFYPHNVILEILISTGLVGLCLWSAIAVWVYQSWEVVIHDWQWIWPLAISYAVHSLLSGALYASSELFAILGILISLGRR